MRGIVVSVGNSEGPALVSLGRYRPAHVLFVVSSGSRSTVDEKVLPNLPAGYLFEHEVVELSDAQAIASSIAEIQVRIRDWIQGAELRPRQDVALDITGGTKAMSVALALAGAAQGACTFVYVGGEKRDTDTGRVVSGHEEVTVDLLPQEPGR